MDPLARRCLFILALFLLWGGAAVAVASAAPDLTVQTFEPPSGAVERTFTILNAARNIGTSPSGVFTVGFVLSSDTTFTIKDTPIGTREIRSLDAGDASATMNTTVTVPDSIPAGSYYLGMFVDTADAVAESDETNNLRSDPDPVTIPSPPAPDIGARYFFVQPGGATRQFLLDAGVQNYGAAPAGPFTVGYYLSTDTAITAADTLLGTRDCAALGVGAEGDAGEYVVVPGTGPGGDVLPRHDHGHGERRRRVERGEQRGLRPRPGHDLGPARPRGIGLRAACRRCREDVRDPRRGHELRPDAGRPVHGGLLPLERRRRSRPRTR